MDGSLSRTDITAYPEGDIMCTTSTRLAPTPSARFGPLFLGVLLGLGTFAAVATADDARCCAKDGTCASGEPRTCEVDAWDEDDTYYPTLTTHYVEVKPGVYLAVRGPSERRRVRIAHWAAVIDGDRRAVYHQLGYPPQRHRENFMDEITEFWTYPDHHVTFVFAGDRLLRTETY
jgi:hypothetical protein